MKEKIAMYDKNMSKYVIKNIQCHAHRLKPRSGVRLALSYPSVWDRILHFSRGFCDDAPCNTQEKLLHLLYCITVS